MISEMGNSTSFNVQMPSQVSNDANKQSPNEDFEKKAQSMGVPENIIKQGKQAVKEWVMESKQDGDANANVKETANQQVSPQEEKKEANSHISLFA